MQYRYLGTAHWNAPLEARDFFPERGSHLGRYSLGLKAVEIHSSFYHQHRAVSYKRPAASTPPGFRFSVKLGASSTILPFASPPSTHWNWETSSMDGPPSG